MSARLAVCSHCILSVYNMYLFSVLVLIAGLPFDCYSSCSLLFLLLLLYKSGVYGGIKHTDMLS